MNRHDRRTARRLRGCQAEYTADPAAPPVHTPEACDGTCHTVRAQPEPSPPRWRRANRHNPDEPAVKLAPDGHGGVKVIYATWFYLVQEVTLAPDGADFGISRAMFRELVLIMLRDGAAHRAKRLAALLGVLLAVRKLAADRAKWFAALFGELAGREHGPPALGRVVVLCHPRTGPPAPVAALEVPVISP